MATQVSNGSLISGATAAHPAVEAVIELQPVIRTYQDEIESGRRLPLALAERFRAAGLYRLLVPRSLGGWEADPLTYFRVVELAAEADGSVGWNIANHAVGDVLALSLPDEGVHEIFAGGPDVLLAGSLATAGATADPVDGGYMVSGRWRFGSGCEEANWMVGNLNIRTDTGLARNPDGTMVMLRGVFPASECTIVDAWNVTGMRGTGSHDWLVERVFLPERRSTTVGPRPVNEWSRWPGTLYSLPIDALFGGCHHSAVATGIARGAIDALTELAGKKTPAQTTGLLRERAQVQEGVGRAEALLGAAQAYRTAVVADVWDTVATGRPVTAEQRVRCRLAAVHAADSANQAVDLMFRAGGTTSIDNDYGLSRCWRDVHAVSQAIGLLPEHYPRGGRVFLGME